MANGWIFRVLLCLAFLAPACVWSFHTAEAGDPSNPREPVLAGKWYPARPEELRERVSGYLSKAAKGATPEGEIRGIIVPHAGYDYSGQVAACAYRAVQGGSFQRVILIGPSHYRRFRGVSIDFHPAYKTPLGSLPVDLEFGRRLIQENPSISFVPQAHDQEHSLEIQIPFLQVALKEARIVPLVMGEQDIATCEGLAGTLIRQIGADRKTLIIASTDLSHKHSDPQARALDGEFIRKVESFDPRGLARCLVDGTCEACGGGPAVTALLACKAIGGDRVTTLRYANSGEINGNRSEVVGYLAAAILKQK